MTFDPYWFGRAGAENATVEVGGRTYTVSEKVDTGKHGHRLWPCSVALAREVAKRKDWKKWLTAELGCGLGLPGMVVANAGASVDFADRERDVRDWLRMGLWFNRLTGMVIPTDWLNYTDVVKYDAILASEVIYPAYGCDSLPSFVARSWTGKGPCLFANSPFNQGQKWTESLRAVGLSVTAVRSKITAPDGRVFEWDLWEVLK